MKALTHEHIFPIMITAILTLAMVGYCIAFCPAWADAQERGGRTGLLWDQIMNNTVKVSGFDSTGRHVMFMDQSGDETFMRVADTEPFREPVAGQGGRQTMAPKSIKA